MPMSFAAIVKGCKKCCLDEKKDILAHLSRRPIGELKVYQCSGVVVVVHHFSNIFSSETACPIKAKGLGSIRPIFGLTISENITSCIIFEFLLTI